MGNRFETLYKFKNNLYKDDSPIIISAGFLLKDSKTESIITQIKFQSVAKKTIQAVKVSINAYDVSGKKITGVDEYQYLDLNIKNGDYFGENKAIIMPDRVTRSIKIEKIIVIYSDGVDCEILGNDLFEIGDFNRLESNFKNPELIKQYQIDTSTNGIFIPKEIGNLWFCTCGTINSEDTCTTCKSNKKDIFSAYNSVLLEEHLAVRLAKEQEERKKQIELEEISKKQKAQEEAIRKKKIIICSIVGCILVIAIIVFSSINALVQRKSAITDIDSLLTEHQYEHAFDIINKSNLSKDKKETYIKTLLPILQNQWNTPLGNSQVLNIDGLVIYEEQNELFYYDENNNTISLYKMNASVDKDTYISDDIIYANGYIFFVETTSTKKYNGGWEFKDDVKYIDIKTGTTHTLDSYCDFYDFTKLKDGNIYINIGYCDNILFDPYNEQVKKTGADIVTEYELDNAIYSTDSWKNENLVKNHIDSDN